MQWFFSLGGVWQALIASLFMYGMTALGASFVFFSGRLSERLLSLCSGAAAGIMVAASFFSLLLPALEYEGTLPAYVPAVLGFGAGALFLVGTGAALSRTERRKTVRGKNALLLFAVTLHNVPEGMAVGVAVAQGAFSGELLPALLLAFGIAMQNFPEGMCVAFPLRQQGMTPKKSFFLAQASGAVEIPSCVLGALAAAFVSGLMPWALSFSAGAMIAVVCSELIPECFASHKTAAGLGVAAGFCLMMLLDVAL